LVALAFVVVTGGKAYYAIVTAPLFMAAGAILLDGWMAVVTPEQRPDLLRRPPCSRCLIAYLTLPILPLATYAKTSLPATVPDTANEVGWPQFVANR